MAATVRLSSCTFLSTPSGWRATAQTAATNAGQSISIHALRVEGDIRRVLKEEF